MKARYSHDCKKCILIGVKKNFDIYIHPAETANRTQIVARRSSDGPDYCSSILSVMLRDPRLYVHEPYNLIVEALAEYAAARAHIQHFLAALED
jgi:hypothetical protein